MFRTNRIKQIAEANQSVFSSAADSQWWLAEPASRPLPAERAPISQPVESPVVQPEQTQLALLKNVEAPAIEVRSNGHVDALQAGLKDTLSHAESNRRTEEGPVPVAVRTDENLTWDAKAGCFMRAAVARAH